MKMPLGFSFWTTLLLMMTQGAFGQLTSTWTGADPSGYWSAPANWSPAGVPVNGNDLVFPGGLPPGDMVSTNDLTDRIFRSIRFTQAGGHTIRGNPITLTNRADCIINSGTNVIACDLTFSGTPPTPDFQYPTIRDSGSGELTVIGNVGGGSLSFLRQQFGTQPRWVIRGQFTGGSLRVGYGTLALYGDNPNAISAVVDHSTLLVQGSQPNLNIRMFSIPQKTLLSSSLSGEGQVGDVTGGTSYLDLDSTLAARNVSVTYVDIRLNGTNVGEYGRLVASGDVSASSGYVSASAGFNPQEGQVYTIVEKTSPGPVTSKFFGPEGSVITLNGTPLRLSYMGGDGNDVTLTVGTTINNPPAVSIINPTNGAIVAAPFGGTIQANATDSDGTVARVDFFSDGALVGSVSNAPFNLDVTNIAAGTHALHAVATDNRGATNRSATVTISVVTPVPIVLSGMRRSFDTQFVFSYTANVGLRYAVERSATLSNWKTIRNHTANANPMTVTDTAATNRMNFYRVKRLPNSAPCGDTPPGCSGFWRGDGDTSDSSGGQHGTAVGNLSYAAAKVGDGFLLNGTNAYVRIPAAPGLDVGLSNGVTMEAWINPYDFSQRRPIFEWHNGTNTFGTHMWILPPGEAGLGAGNLYVNVVTVDNYLILAAPGGTLTTNTLQHVAATFDKASGWMRIYRNGELVAEENFSGWYHSDPETSYDLYLGARPAGSGASLFKGIIDEASIYNRALSQEEIKGIYNAGSSGKCPN